jgi:hypothetical protein
MSSVGTTRRVFVALAVVDVVLGGGGLFGWVVVTTTYPSIGPATPTPWEPGGLGLPVVVFFGLVILAGIRLASGSRAGWLGWVQLGLAPVLVIPAWNAVSGATSGGSPIFFAVVGAACIAGIAIALYGALVLIPRGRSRST